MEEKQMLRIVAEDEWLKPVAEEIELRHSLYEQKMSEIEHACGSIINYANGYRYFGWQYDEDMSGWWFREWLPEAEWKLLSEVLK